MTTETKLELCVKEPINEESVSDSTPRRAKHLMLVDGAQLSKYAKSIPRRPKNSDVRSREYLTLDEVNRLRDAAKKTGRYGVRDYWLITMAYRHGLRASELT